MSWTKSSKGTMHPFLFTPPELRQLLSAYSEGVLKKHWKDYGIQAGKKETLFAVIDRGDNIANTAIICALKKIKPAKHNQDYHFMVYEGDKPVLKTTSFLEALEKFRALNPRASSRIRKNDHLKVIS